MPRILYPVRFEPIFTGAAVVATPTGWQQPPTQPTRVTKLSTAMLAATGQAPLGLAIVVTPPPTPMGWQPVYDIIPQGRRLSGRNDMSLVSAPFAPALPPAPLLGRPLVTWMD